MRKMKWRMMIDDVEKEEEDNDVEDENVEDDDENDKDDNVTENEVEDADVEDDDVKGEEDDDVENDDAEEEEDEDVEEDDVEEEEEEEEDRPQDRSPHFARACAVEAAHGHLRKAAQSRIYSKNADQMEHPDQAPAFATTVRPLSVETLFGEECFATFLPHASSTFCLPFFHTLDCRLLSDALIL
eukprot:s708_g15.t1